MNTPSSKPIERYQGPQKYLPKRSFKEGRYRLGFSKGDFATKIGQIVAAWSHLEENMITVFGFLLGGLSNDAAHPIFRSITAERLRADIMSTLLRTSPANKDKGPIYDEILSEFVSLNKLRNDYVHGLWYTHIESGKVALAEPRPDNPMPFAAQKPVSYKQVVNTLTRIHDLRTRIQRELVPTEIRAIVASLETPPKQESETSTQSTAPHTKSKARPPRRKSSQG